MTDFETKLLFCNIVYTIATIIYTIATIVLASVSIEKWTHNLKSEAIKDKNLVKNLCNSLYKDLLKMQECKEYSCTFHKDAVKTWNEKYSILAKVLDHKTYSLLDSVFKNFFSYDKVAGQIKEMNWVTACKIDEDILVRLEKAIDRLEKEYKLKDYCK